MADLKKITELETIESVENVEGVAIIANDNGQAKQIPASLIGGLSGGGGGSACYYVAYGNTHIYTDRELTTVVKADELKDAILNKHVVFIDAEQLYGDDNITFPTHYMPYNMITISVYSSNNQRYMVDK